MELEKKITEIELGMFEQEHRLIPILRNVYYTFNIYKNQKDIKSAIYKSFIYRIFSPSTVITGGIGVITLIGLLIAIRANYLFEEQNRKLDTQNYLMEAERRASLMFELTSILEQIQKEIDKPNNVALNRKDNKVTISDYTKGRIVALSRSLRPYRFLTLPRDSSSLLSLGNENDIYQASEEKSSFSYVFLKGLGALPSVDGPRLIEKDMSPERGQLLLSLHKSNINLGDVISGFPDFSRSVYDGSELAFTDVSNIYFTGSSARKTDFTNTNFSNANLGDVDFTNSELSGANFTGCICINTTFVEIDNFTGTILSNPRNYIGSDFTGSNFEGAVVPDKDWFSRIKALNPKIIGIDYDIWKIVEVKSEEEIKHVITKI